MFGFLKNLGEGVREGQRAGRTVKLIQRVIQRPLGGAEINVFKQWYDEHSYPESVMDHDILVDYFMYLTGKEEDDEGKRPIMSDDAKERLIEALRGAINWGIIPDEHNDYVDILKRHAGLGE